MTPGQWRRVRDLFEEAVEMPVGEVDRWLTRVESDPVVIGELRSLLNHHSRAGAFLDAAVTERVAGLVGDEAVFEPGATLGFYTIEREIGRGGMGWVYLATDRRLGRKVALKVLAPRFVRDEAQRERLRHEARAAASLSHPGICTIYALEEIDGHVAIAAEYIDGHSLRQEIGSSPPPATAGVIDAARQLSSALAAAHTRGVTHRDLKPENIMRAAGGRLKILDFGLALVEPRDGEPGSPRMTSPDVLVGTPLYMAPEQIDHGTVDVRTDVFALGVVLYEFATGVHPFEANSAMAVVARILESTPRPVESVRADLPRTLAGVIERCLRKNRDERYASASEVLRAVDGDEVRSPGPGPTAWWRTHMAATLLLYFVAAAAAWLLKEWDHGLADAVFVAVALAAAIGGVFRGHLLFAERTHDLRRVEIELQRTAPMLTAVDLAIGAALLLEGLWTTRSRPVAGVLVAGFAIWFPVARLWIEPSTTDAAFAGARSPSSRA
ncbi:MAG TPA: serine/threonine-protein kinase [Vicinamibacterales bacterium]|nr:serine/threonine-protein kinase [Vicinamibacterales bacterium]